MRVRVEVTMERNVDVLGLTGRSVDVLGLTDRRPAGMEEFKARRKMISRSRRDRTLVIPPAALTLPTDATLAGTVAGMRGQSVSVAGMGGQSVSNTHDTAATSLARKEFNRNRRVIIRNIPVATYDVSNLRGL